MFISFFLELRAAKVPASLREFLTLMQAMQQRVALFDIEEFYFLARATLVKDERHLDRFDRVFGQVFKGIETPSDPQTELPEEWLIKLGERHLTEEEKQLLLELLCTWTAAADAIAIPISLRHHKTLAGRPHRFTSPGRCVTRNAM